MFTIKSSFGIGQCIWSWAWYTEIIQGQVSNKTQYKSNLTVGEDGVQDVKENI